FKKRAQLAERIAESDELVRQVKQLQKQLDDLRRTAGEVTQLYQNEKKKREELERSLNEQSQRSGELEKELDVQQLNCEQLQEQLKIGALPVDAKKMVTIFMQLSQRVGEDSPASGLLRREHNLLRKLKEYCKSAKITIPPAPVRSPPSKRTKATTTATQTTQTSPPHDAPSKPEMCSIAVQSENLVTTRNQGTQHKNMTTTRGTTTASFIKKHDVGTCFPEPKAPLSVQQILSDMLKWGNSIRRPLSPIGDLQPESQVVRTISTGTCTHLCNVQREINYLPDVPADLKRSISRPPSRASVKDELAAPASGAYGHHMAKELLNILPHNQSILTDLPPHVFNEIWQVMGQMVLVVLQRRSTNASLAIPTPTPPPPISQADFSSWFDALHESSLNLAMSSNKGKPITVCSQKPTANKLTDLLVDHGEIDVPSEEPVGRIEIGTDPMLTPPPAILSNELTPIRLPVKPKIRWKPRLKPKPKKKKRRVIKFSKSSAKSKQSENICETAESAVNFLSNLNVFKSPNCDISDIQLDSEEQILLEMTSAAANLKQSSVAFVDCDAVIPQTLSQSTSAQNQMECELKKGSPAVYKKDTRVINHSSTSSQVASKPKITSVKPSHQDQVESPLNNDTTSKDKKSPLWDGTEVPTTSKFSSSSYQKQVNVLFGSDEDSDDEQSQHKEGSPDRQSCSSSISVDANQRESSQDKVASASCQNDGTEDPSTYKFSSSSYQKQFSVLFGSDVDSDDAKSNDNEGSPDRQSCSSSISVDTNQRESSLDIVDSASSLNDEFNSLSESDEEGNEVSPTVYKKDTHATNHASTSSQLTSNALDYSKEEQLSVNKQISVFDAASNCVHPSLDNNERLDNYSDVESIESGCGLVIDDADMLDNESACSDEETRSPTRAIEAIEPVTEVKRKRKASSSSSLEYQPFEKRLTRLQAKQLILESPTNVNEDNCISINASEEPQPIDTTFYSPMSPVAAADCKASDNGLIEIPLKLSNEEQHASEPKALLSYIVNAVKADGKQCGKYQQSHHIKPSQLEHLKLKVVKHMIGTEMLDLLLINCFSRDAALAFDVMISAYGTDEVKVEDFDALERLLLVVRRIDQQNNSFIQQFMNVLEQRLFALRERLGTQMSHKCLRLYLHLATIQRSLTLPAHSYVNPARLLLAKILYHYKNDMTMLVLEVFMHFPTVLPYREERDYNHADPLITVIKHLLMNHKYEVQDAAGADRELLSKLRFQYHFQPYEPTRQQVIDNLVEKLKVGRLNQLCYAFALFCRRATPTQVIKNVLEAQLLPLANSYCDLCLQSEEYDARMKVLLQSISMIVKQMPLGQQINIANYIALFKRILIAVPRPGVQQAAVQAILRTQRFGYGFVLEALQSYKPNYPLSPMTRAMMRSYADRRQQYVLARKVSCRKVKTAK
ncbi:hypothetical protein KR093_001444, partial [Drosophila rubida]